jgi:hypothetical protein
MELKLLGAWPISAKDAVIVIVPGAIVTFLALYFHCDEVIEPKCVHLPDEKSLIAAAVVAAFVVGLLPTAPLITCLWDGVYDRFYRKKDKDGLYHFARAELRKDLDAWWPPNPEGVAARNGAIEAHINTVNIYKWALEQVKHSEDKELAQALTGAERPIDLPGKALTAGLAWAQQIEKKDDKLQAISKLCRSLSILCFFIGVLVVPYLMWPKPDWIIVGGCVAGWLLFASLFFQKRLEATNLAYKQFSELRAHALAAQGAAPVVPDGVSPRRGHHL